MTARSRAGARRHPARAAALAALLAAVAGCRDAPTTRALGDWYDRREGIGAPCSPRTPREVRFSGIALDVPACFEVMPRGDELQLRDKALGLGYLALRVRTLPDERKAAEALAGRTALMPGAAPYARGPFRGVSLVTTKAGRAPSIVHVWFLVGAGREIGVNYAAPKVMLESPKLAGEVATAEEIVGSIRPAP